MCREIDRKSTDAPGSSEPGGSVSEYGGLNVARRGPGYTRNENHEPNHSPKTYQNAADHAENGLRGPAWPTITPARGWFGRTDDRVRQACGPARSRTRGRLRSVA